MLFQQNSLFPQILFVAIYSFILVFFWSKYLKVVQIITMTLFKKWGRHGSITSPKCQTSGSLERHQRDKSLPSNLLPGFDYALEVGADMVDLSNWSSLMLLLLLFPNCRITKCLKFSASVWPRALPPPKAKFPLLSCCPEPALGMPLKPRWLRAAVHWLKQAETILRM